MYGAFLLSELKMFTEGVSFTKNIYKYAPSNLKCTVCGKEASFIGIAPFKVGYSDLEKCMLFEFSDHTIDFELCHNCNLHLIRCGVGLDYMKNNVQKYAQDATRCFMCNTKYGLAPFGVKTNKTELLLLERLNIMYNVVFKENNNICQVCHKLYDDLVDLHVLYHNCIKNTIYAKTTVLLNQLASTFQELNLKSLNLSDQPSTSHHNTTNFKPDKIMYTFTDTCPYCGFIETYDKEMFANETKPPDEIADTTHNTKHSTSKNVFVEDFEEDCACPVSNFSRGLWETDGSDLLTLINKKNSNDILLFNARTVNMRNLNDTYEDAFTHIVKVVIGIIDKGCNLIQENVISKFHTFECKTINNDISLTKLDEILKVSLTTMSDVLTSIEAVFDKDYKIPVLNTFSERCSRHIKLAKLQFLNKMINFVHNFSVIYNDIYLTRLGIIKENAA